MLHITNGQSTIQGLAEGAVPGAFLAWKDPLHDGPVTEMSSLEELSRVRARALAAFGWGSEAVFHAEFADRDRTLSGFREYDETILWFEHDLYDQLQLIQLLDWFSRQDLDGVHLSLIQIGDYAGSMKQAAGDAGQTMPPFYGLGQLRGVDLAALLPTRSPVTAAQFDAARRAWQAVRSTDPSGLVAIAEGVSREMPFLGPATVRLLEEYPSAANGLSRLEQELLVSGALGARTGHALYRQSQSFESCPWGDSSVFLRLHGLASAPVPAFDRLGDDEFRINELGRRLLAGDADWIVSSGGIDRWLGGVHLSGTSVRWRWSGQRRALVETS
jgi:hypothetical protein